MSKKLLNGNAKKKAQLGMALGTASGRLKKSIMFSLIVKLGENVCFQCGTEIETEQELSIEHKVPWLDSYDPIGLFFDLENISFSHLTCNCVAANITRKKYHTEEDRLQAKANHNKVYRANKKALDPEEVKRSRRARYIRTNN